MDMRYPSKPKSLLMHGQLEEIMHIGMMLRVLYQRGLPTVQLNSMGLTLNISLLRQEGGCAQD